MRLANDGILGDSEPTSDLGGGMALIPECAQTENGLVGPVHVSAPPKQPVNTDTIARRVD